MGPLETRSKSVPEAQDYDEDSARCWMLMWWNKWSRGCPVALSFPVKICKREAEVRRGLGEFNGDCLQLEMAG